MSEFSDFLKEKETREFLQQNLHSDVQKLLLNPPSAFRNRIRGIVDQILSRRKAKGKLDSWYSNFDLILPPPLSVEQSSSEKTSEFKKSILSGDHLIDLTGGMGIDCLALSENFTATTYVEQQKPLADIFRHNSRVLKKEISVVNEEAQAFLDQTGLPKNTSVYIDPARRNSAKNRVFRLEDCSPDISALLPTLKNKARNVLIKLSPLLDIKSVLSQSDHVKEVYVVSVKNECKELLFLIDFAWTGEPKIRTINMEATDQLYDFEFPEEEREITAFESPSKFLFEPNSSILKAGAFRKAGTDFNVKKIHPNTHLYTSDRTVPGWPGRTFEVVATAVSKKNLKEFAPDGFINVITRNYPVTTKALKTKFRVKDGGSYFLIGFTGMNNDAKLVVARKC